LLVDLRDLILVDEAADYGGSSLAPKGESGEPISGANAFRLPRTRRDCPRAFMQVRGSPFDSDRPRSTHQNCFTPKRSLVRSQYRPPGLRRSEPGFRGREAWLLIICQPFVNGTGQHPAARPGALGDHCWARPSFASKGSGVRIPSSPPRKSAQHQVRGLIGDRVDQALDRLAPVWHQDFPASGDRDQPLAIPQAVGHGVCVDTLAAEMRRVGGWLACGPGPLGRPLLAEWSTACLGRWRWPRRFALR
jgi:hypothetical protein